MYIHGFNINHAESCSCSSQCCHLFRAHKGEVYSISMVIKPGWKACGQICVRVCVCAPEEGWACVLLRWKALHWLPTAYTQHSGGFFCMRGWNAAVTFLHMSRCFSATTHSELWDSENRVRHWELIVCIYTVFSTSEERSIYFCHCARQQAGAKCSTQKLSSKCRE